MSEDTKATVVDAVRAEFERGTDTARKEFERNAEDARDELDRRADDVRKGLGARVVDLTEEYFQEEVSRRRRKVAVAAFGAGVAVGAVTTIVLGR